MLPNFAECVNISLEFVDFRADFCNILAKKGKCLTRNWVCRAVQRSALCRSRRELSNAYFLAKFGFDTAENEPCEVCPIERSPRRRAGAAAQRGIEALVEKFDIEPYSDFSAKWSNFIGLSLFSTDAKFCKKICVWKLSPRSTQCTPLHSSAISIFCLKIAKFKFFC